LSLRDEIGQSSSENSLNFPTTTKESSKLRLTHSLIIKL